VFYPLLHYYNRLKNRKRFVYSLAIAEFLRQDNGAKSCPGDAPLAPPDGTSGRNKGPNNVKPLYSG
jgi:hypothetical protein